MNKTVLITGASRGIGNAIARAFAKEGCRLIINCSKSPDALFALATELQTDIVVNNAGISHIGLLGDMTIEEWNHIISVNLTSVFSTSKLAIPHMLHQKSGKIINISSIWGNVGASCEVAYSACKGGINAFTRALAKELAPSNIQVNALACGAINTQMNDFLDEAERAALLEEIPAGRMGEASEAAEMIRLLAEAPAYLTGQVIAFDGGWQ